MSVPSPALERWVEQAVNSHFDEVPAPFRWQGLGGDAGHRQYFRLNTRPSALAVLAPPETENSHAFLTIATHLRQHGLRTPKVIAHDLEQGFLLIEDLGQDLLLDHLTCESVDVLYGEVLMDLLRLQQLQPDPTVFPPYSKDKLRTELQVFDSWFVERLLGYALSGVEQELLADLYGRLEQSALEQRQVIVHRDFHSRNLVYTAGSALGLIDFQDAMIGPLTYDLVSLLRDCYVQWPAEKVERWALAYASMAEDVGLITQLEPDEFLRQFDWMGLQRHIKVLGVFARLSLRDGKHGYLHDLPRVVHYVRSISGRYREFAAFADWFERALLPLIQKQQWYKAGQLP